MLFIFAKLNPGLTYVQGMNELLAPLYYLFATDRDARTAGAAEPDAFYCFVDLISEFRDNFCSQLDNSSVGIRATISSLNELLKQRDRQLWYHLQVSNKVSPSNSARAFLTCQHVKHCHPVTLQVHSVCGVLTSLVESPCAAGRRRWIRSSTRSGGSRCC